MRRDSPPAPLGPPLLAWYDARRATLPWRARDGGAADPYRVWLSEIMLQQTTVAAIAPRFEAFASRWPTVEALAAAPEADVMAAWAGLGYYARARNLIAAARVVAAAGSFPSDEAGLRALPGVGEYTAAAIAAIAFGRAALPVDANVARVGARLLARDIERGRVRAAIEPRFASGRPGDVAQALMDLGRTVCAPRAPRCAPCPLRGGCAGAASGTPERWPARVARGARPLRRGVAFWLECEGEVFVVRRPGRGLLGGMTGLPTSAWEAALDPGAALADAPVAAAWRLLAAPVRHVFTHFELELWIATARIDRRPRRGGRWVARGAIGDEGLPTLFARVAGAVERDGQRVAGEAAMASAW